MPLRWAMRFTFFRRNEEAIKLSGFVQMLLLLMGAIMLDNGGFLKMMLLGAIAYWVALAIIMVRRDDQVSWTDRAVLRWGFLPMVIGAGLLVAV